ncbi:Glycosyl hydrolases family 15 [Paenibacillus sp. UNCCL117]|uniref:glycoside hydrolase family 15 protein n=1 Tax=unclassified Paenibacillus TaxID=185978 RepID=UPI0008807EF6|nr:MULTISPECIES: glycoside hydrolase family 15 protein [unclassified Paenibacillus]SDC72912.1 Glycosyl hydrolases family 15 [Paenibacillus sp. cl123]SFW24897.1 Glycosyl hydrolases family 15 [Paenibacillus sp. UNCCL117]
MINRSKLDKLAEDSIRLIRWNQHERGAYTASPLFSHYGFGWLRDGSFVAYSMDLSGRHESSRLFHEWVSRIIERKASRIDELIARKQRGEYIERREFLHTRYQLDGRDDADSEWGHFQLDGYGTWLWGLCAHLKTTGHTEIPDIYRTAVAATVRYLQAFWEYTNFDCWEEYSDWVHPATLACIYGGLSAAAELDKEAAKESLSLCSHIREFLLRHAVHADGYFVKSIRPQYPEGRVEYEIGYDGVDASLLWLCEPFRVFETDHPVMRRTIEKIRDDLRTAQGGVRRYSADTYYGGGEWLLLTAWYGWAALARGSREEAEDALGWVASKADPLGRMPEQVPDALSDRSGYEEWTSRWGPPASPLLWSHAMFLVLYNKLY